MTVVCSSETKQMIHAIPFCKQLESVNSFLLPFLASGTQEGGGGSSDSGPIFGWLDDVLLMHVHGVVILKTQCQPIIKSSFLESSHAIELYDFTCTLGCHAFVMHNSCSHFMTNKYEVMCYLINYLKLQSE